MSSVKYILHSTFFIIYISVALILHIKLKNLKTYKLKKLIY